MSLSILSIGCRIRDFWICYWIAVSGWISNDAFPKPSDYEICLLHIMMHASAHEPWFKAKINTFPREKKMEHLTNLSFKYDTVLIHSPIYLKCMCQWTQWNFKQLIWHEFVLKVALKVASGSLLCDVHDAHITRSKPNQQNGIVAKERNWWNKDAKMCVCVHVTAKPS